MSIWNNTWSKVYDFTPNGGNFELTEEWGFGLGGAFETVIPITSGELAKEYIKSYFLLLPSSKSHILFHALHPNLGKSTWIKHTKETILKSA
jgi:hypothetical protein